MFNFARKLDLYRTGRHSGASQSRSATAPGNRADLMWKRLAVAQLLPQYNAVVKVIGPTVHAL